VTHATLIAWTVTTYTNFIASMFLLWIFLKFLPETEKEDIINKTTEIEESRGSVLKNCEEEDEVINHCKDYSHMNANSFVGDEPEL
jgi:membrane protein implicated in regulation of membrane protease activity